MKERHTLKPVVLLTLAVAVLLITDGGQALAAVRAHASGGKTHAAARGSRTEIDWAARDRAVYVVSTLNAPLCQDGRELSSVLSFSDRVREFDVLQSPADRNLYYVVVHRQDGARAGVYAYRFGWKLPMGVREAQCVQPAPANVVRAYNPARLATIARFDTTFPQG